MLSYRPIPEYFAYVEKRVVVSGERYQPDGQAIAGPHFRVESMRLAEGETARATIPTALPVPPMVPTGPALERREDRWVQVVGTVNRARERQPDSDWEDVVVTLDDGTEVRVRESHWVAERLYGPLAGQRATITGRLLRDPEGHWRLGAATATCEGEVDGCGMTVQPLLRR